MGEGGVGNGWNHSTPPNTRAQGEAAVERDIRRAVFPLKGDGYYDVKVRKRINLLVRNEDVPALQAMIRNGVFGSAHVGVKVLPAGNEYTAHQNSRASRGRVTSKTQKFAVPGDSYLKKYIKEAKHGVGQAKGGWAPSLTRLGGKCPQWVSRHRNAGTFYDSLNLQGWKKGKFVFSMINFSEWAKSGDIDRIVDTVMADRAQAMQLDIANRVERAIKEAK
jgi:hypothetical protein